MDHSLDRAKKLTNSSWEGKKYDEFNSISMLSGDGGREYNTRASDDASKAVLKNDAGGLAR